MPTGVYKRTEEHKKNIGLAQLGEKNHQYGKRYIITPAIERFWKLVKKTETCWIWVGKGKSGGGYGQIKIKGKNVSAHRFSYELHNGRIPKGDGYHGTCVLHTCDNRLCVNPQHLWLGTNADNIHDMERKGRGVHPRGPHKNKNYDYKLT